MRWDLRTPKRHITDLEILLDNVKDAESCHLCCTLRGHQMAAHLEGKCLPFTATVTMLTDAEEFRSIPGGNSRHHSHRQRDLAAQSWCRVCGTWNLKKKVVVYVSGNDNFFIDGAMADKKSQKPSHHPRTEGHGQRSGDAHG